ncbi:MAG: hypothetical protein LC112_10950 [Flavobacteriales bacterium]|nr:hypothetical protein [Flavobacteriales bacterium]
MKLQKRFKNRFVMVPINATGSCYRRDYNADWFKIKTSQKLEKIMDKKFDAMLERMNWETRLTEMSRKIKP